MSLKKQYKRVYLEIPVERPRRGKFSAYEYVTAMNKALAVLKKAGFKPQPRALQYSKE